jgi:hypothetical protein
VKQLYFLHIPKTAGQYISKNIKESLDENNITHHITTHFPNNNGFVNKAYVSMHAGTYPIEKVPGIDVATIVRNPIEARVSYFNFVYNKALYNRPEYTEKSLPIEKLRYYLFEDPNFELHNNYQSRFICNSADERSFQPMSFYKDHYEELMYPFLKKGEAFTWFVENDHTTLDNAMSQINKFKIKSTLDNIDLFKQEINSWFKDNYNVDIKFASNKINIGTANYGDGNFMSSSELLSLLTESEKEKIIENNYIDYAVYKHLKEIENEK